MKTRSYQTVLTLQANSNPLSFLNKSNQQISIEKDENVTYLSHTLKLILLLIAFIKKSN